MRRIEGQNGTAHVNGNCGAFGTAPNEGASRRAELSFGAGCCSSQSCAVVVFVPFCFPNPPHPRPTLLPDAVRSSQLPTRRALNAPHTDDFAGGEPLHLGRT